jgi:hypothetical protein
MAPEAPAPHVCEQGDSDLADAWRERISRRPCLNVADQATVRLYGEVEEAAVLQRGTPLDLLA